MTQRRFCDLCDREIEVHERWYDVMVSVRRDSHGADAIDQQYAEFCYGCVKSGKAAAELIARYESRTGGPPSNATEDA